jgi:hypothetical protein
MLVCDYEGNRTRRIEIDCIVDAMAEIDEKEAANTPFSDWIGDLY